MDLLSGVLKDGRIRSITPEGAIFEHFGIRPPR
jgi:hypothetical protein